MYEWDVGNRKSWKWTKMLGGGNKILGRGSHKKCNRSSYRIVETPKNTNTPFLYTLFQSWEILFAWSYAARNLKIPVICAWSEFDVVVLLAVGRWLVSVSWYLTTSPGCNQRNSWSEFVVVVVVLLAASGWLVSVSWYLTTSPGCNQRNSWSEFVVVVVVLLAASGWLVSVSWYLTTSPGCNQRNSPQHRHAYSTPHDTVHWSRRDRSCGTQKCSQVSQVKPISDQRCSWNKHYSWYYSRCRTCQDGQNIIVLGIVLGACSDTIST